MLRKKKLEDHADEAEEGRELIINFAWVVFVGLQIGYTEEDIARMTYGKWSELSEQWMKYHNIVMKKEVFREREKITSLEDI